MVEFCKHAASQMATHGIFGIFIFIIISGTVGNIISFLVVVFKGKKTSTNFLLSVLIFVDIIYLVLYLIKNALNEHIEQHRQHVDVQLINILIFRRIVLDEIHRVVQLITVWLIVLLAWIRSVAIRSPYFAMKHCTKRNIIIGSLIITITCSVIHLPYSLIWINTSCKYLLNVTCIYQVEPDKRMSDFIFYYPHAVYNMCLLFLFPGFFVCVFSIFLIKQLRCRGNGLQEPITYASSNPQKSNSTKLTERRTKNNNSTCTDRRKKDSSDVTKLVLTTVFIFLVTYFAHFLNGLYWLLVDINILTRLGPCVEMGIVYTIFLVSVLNASVHFATNFIFRQYFRQSCKSLCSCFFRRKVTERMGSFRTTATRLNPLDSIKERDNVSVV